MHIADVQIQLVGDDIQYLHDDTHLVYTVQLEGRGVGYDILLLAFRRLLVAQVAFDGSLRFGGGHDAEPLALRTLTLGCHNLHLIAALQHVRDRHHLVVHLRPDTMFAQVGVHHVGKIQYGRILRQRLYFAFGRKDKHLVRKQIQLEVIQECHGIGIGVLQYLLDILQPLIQLRSLFLFARLVFPVCRQAVFGYLVHPFASNLHLYPLAFVTHDSYVQRLIAVGFGRRDPVTDTFGVRTIHICHGGIDAPTLVFLRRLVIGLEDDTNGHQVVDVVERHMLLVHLPPDGIDRFDTRARREDVPQAVQLLANRAHERLIVFHLLFFHGRQALGYLLVFIGVSVFEAQVL